MLLPPPTPHSFLPQAATGCWICCAVLLYVRLPFLAGCAGVAGVVCAFLMGRAPAPDVFNIRAETFPQEERRRENSYSVNLRTRYQLNGRTRKGWINILQPFRGLLVMGSPGSGKTHFIIRPLLEQQIQKGFTLFVYDFKFDDLSRHVYNILLSRGKDYPVKPAFFLIHFDDLSRSHRCNPLDPATLTDLSDAGESARTILLGLNRDWIRRQGDFFVESAINLLTALIWFLKKYKKGIYCTLPHAIELLQRPYEELFPTLRTEPDIDFLISPFVSAYLAGVMPQLEGQIGGAKISLARLTAPHLYYILSGNDFTLDINNPAAPKIVCIGNTPAKQQVYGAVVSLYVSRLVRLVNQKDRLPCSLVFDEFPTLYFNGMDTLLATARSNRVATTIAIQDMSQLRKEYGKEQSEVLLNITGNIISGAVSGDSAQALSARFGRILQERTSIRTNPREQSITTSSTLEPALPPSRISALSSGEMVGILSDAPDKPVSLKLFHGRVAAGRAHPAASHRHRAPAPDVDIPLLPHPPTLADISANHARIKNEVSIMVQECLALSGKTP